VAEVQILDGQKLLAASAEQNVRTWQFAPHDPTSFDVTYRFKIVNKDPSVVLRLPTDVEISAMPPQTVDATPDIR
jgi:hypothetical protein